MKAIRVHAHGGPEVMRLEDVPEPQPKPGEAVVKMLPDAAEAHRALEARKTTAKVLLIP